MGLRCTPFRDVEEGRDATPELALVVEHRCRRHHDVDTAAVGTLDLALEGRYGLAGMRRAVQRLLLRRKLPVAPEDAERRPGRPKSRAVAALAALAQQQRAMAVDANRVGAVVLDDQDTDRQEIEQRLQALQAVAQIRRQLPDARLRCGDPRDVEERDDHAADHVVDRAVRHHAHDVACVVVVAFDLAFDGRERAQYALGVLLHGIRLKRARTWVIGRPVSLSTRRNRSLAAGVKLLTARLRSRNTVAICVLSSRLAMSELARLNSSTRALSSALTVCSSSLIDCSSSFEVSSSSLADCSSSLIEDSSSLVDFSSSLEDLQLLGRASAAARGWRAAPSRAAAGWRFRAPRRFARLSVGRRGRDAADVLENHHDRRHRGSRPCGCGWTMRSIGLAAAIGAHRDVPVRSRFARVPALWTAAAQVGPQPGTRHAVNVRARRAGRRLQILPGAGRAVQDLAVGVDHDVGRRVALEKLAFGQALQRFPLGCARRAAAVGWRRPPSGAVSGNSGSGARAAACA